jgi:hypothetical protein
VAEEVQFEQMGQLEFDRVVEALLTAEHRGHGFRVQALDGRGGDGGIDVGMWDMDDNVVRIFQLKYFPDGFSGMRGGRRAQVKRSFETAWTNHQPPHWTLVIPGNPTREEQDYVLRLRGDRKMHVDIIGRAELDILLGKHPHLLDRFTTDRTLQYLGAINRPEEALARGRDIPLVLDRMQDRLQVQSENWAWAFGTDGLGNHYQHLVARHPGAQLAEPLMTKMTATFTEDDEDLRRRFTEAMRFGVAEAIVLPGRILSPIENSGAPWFEGHEEVDEVHLLPEDADAGRAVTLIAEDENERRLGTIDGTVKRIARGTDGVQLVVDVIGGLTARWVIPRSVESPPQYVTFETSNGGAPARDVRLLTKFMARIDDAHRVVIKLDGKDFAGFTLTGGDRHAPDPAFMAFLDDLVTIENALDVRFVYPADGVSVTDRLWAATLRQMLNGYAVPMPHVDGYNITLSGKYDNTLLEQLRGDGMSLVSVRKQFEITLIGTEIYLEDVFIHQQYGIAEGGADHADALEAGKGQGRVVHVVGHDGLPWVIYQPSRHGDDDSPVPVAGWKAAGLPEHSGLKRLIELRGELAGVEDSTPA